MAAELAARGVWIALGVAIAWMARSLGLGTLAEPGPGMLACGLGVAMAVVAAAGAVNDLRRLGAGTNPQATPRGAAVRIVGLCVGLLAYIAALVPIGFPIATFVFLLALFRIFAGIGWPRAIAVSAGFTLVAYALFRHGLGTQLPPGLLG